MKRRDALAGGARIALTGLVAGMAAITPIVPALADPPKTDPQLDHAAAAALRRLVAGNTAARLLNEKANAVLVFPKIVKVGFLLGGAYGEGALRQGGKTLGYYNSAAASYGLQAGVQWFGYALFFMNAAALKYLDDSQGFEIGVGPSVVVVDEGVAKKISSTTLSQDAYAFIFNQKGLMAGIGLEGSKITRIH
ncbi:MAG: YSC84-related protein [Xanthobacteraceae bacterium]|nr:YSC84-related protein [Xanthobacteraceae bacterium]